MSASRTKKKRQRTHRYTSNVFSMFNQDQIQEFKEAFNMIDQNRDGFVDKDDLIEMLTSLGKDPNDLYVDEMIRQAPGPINFTMFLTLFGEKLNGTDPEDVIRNAFGCFDLKSLGYIPEDELREIMTTMGDRWEHSMVDELLHGAPIHSGLFDYVEFTRTLKHGAREKEGEQHPADPPPSPAPNKPPPQMTFPVQPKQTEKKPQPKQVEKLKPAKQQQQQPPPPATQQPPPQQPKPPAPTQPKPSPTQQPIKLDAVPKKSSLKPAKSPKPQPPSPSDASPSSNAPPLPKSPPPPLGAGDKGSSGGPAESKASPFGAVLKKGGMGGKVPKRF